MTDKPLSPSTQPSGETAKPDTQWVMVFNLYMKIGKEETKKTYKVNKKRIVIGSALSSDIRIQQNAVSNVHAVVEMDEAGRALIFDMASETGVFVNDKRSVSEELKDGDEVKVGFATLTFKRVAVNEAAKAAPAESMRTTGSGRKLFLDAQEDFRPLILEDERNVIQIFDYPNSGEQCLQVVMYWGDVILDVEHFVDGESITMGEKKKNSFLVPGLPPSFELVKPEGAASTVSLHKEMKGVLRTGGKMLPLEELGARFQLKQNDIAKIQFRDITFFVSYSPLPPHLRRQRVLERDPLYMQIWFTSFGLTAAFIALMATFTPEKKLDTEELSPRVATVIFKPVPPPPPPPVKVEKKAPPVEKKEPPKEVKPPKVVKPPKPPKVKTPPKEKPPKLPVEMKTPPKEKAATPKVVVKGSAPNPGGGNQGAGARAAGPEGPKGAPNKPKAPVHMNDSKGNPNTKTPTKSQVQGPGNVEAMFSDISGNISKSMAAGAAGARAAGQNLKGYGAFTTEGKGGLGDLGDGKGGGGKSQTVQGLGTEGFGDGKTGKGLGAIGSGGSLAGTGVGRPSVEVGNGSETIIRGGLDRSVIDEYIKRHWPQIRACYERQLNGAKGRLAGNIRTRFEISGSGVVNKAGVTLNGIGVPAIGACVVDVLRHIVFPEPVGGGVVEVDYGFSFTPAISGN